MVTELNCPWSLSIIVKPVHLHCCVLQFPRKEVKKRYPVPVAKSPPLAAHWGPFAALSSSSLDLTSITILISGSIPKCFLA